MSAEGFDCLVLPGAVNPMTTSLVFKTQFCGNKKGIGTIDAALTVCSKFCAINISVAVQIFPILGDRQPFNIRFLSDSFETQLEAQRAAQEGFRLTYFQTSTGC